MRLAHARQLMYTVPQASRIHFGGCQLAPWLQSRSHIHTRIIDGRHIGLQTDAPPPETIVVLIRLFAAGKVLSGVYHFVYVAAPLNLLDLHSNPKPTVTRLQQASAVLRTVHPQLH